MVLLLAACAGGDDPPTAVEYEEAVVNAVDRTDYALNRVARSQSVPEAIKRMEEASAAIDSAAGDLEELGARWPWPGTRRRSPRPPGASGSGPR